jgi:hypothetical protein
MYLKASSKVMMHMEEVSKHRTKCPAALPHTQTLNNPLGASSEETAGKPPYPSRVTVRIHSLVYESSPYPWSGRPSEDAKMWRRRGGYRAMGRRFGSTVTRDTDQEQAGVAAKVV